MERIVLDACVLNNHLQRDILLSHASDGWYRLVLSHEIINEFKYMMIKHKGQSRANDLVRRLNHYFKDTILAKSDYTYCFQHLNHVNEKDQHVAALAYHVRPSTIITYDKDFQEELVKDGLRFSKPDEYLCNLLNKKGEKVILSYKNAKSLQETIKSTLIDANKFIKQLEDNELTETAKVLGQYKRLL